jgi:hypothetical protein
MKPNEPDTIDPTPAALPPLGSPNDPAWEKVEKGRYRPKRIRGSCRGRELG